MKFILCVLLVFYFSLHGKAQNGIPIIEISTENSQPVESKEKYIKGSIKVVNSLNLGEEIIDSCQIRGRGNATWKDYPKKPYKIKFYNKQGLFGFPANKDWVLLAEYCDKSLLRTAYMCEVSKAVGIDYTVNYQHVELVLNDEYLGVYVLTDQVEKAKNRVKVEEDGYFIEDDSYYHEEPLFFTSSLGYNYTFKYPNSEKGKIIENDDNFNFIKDGINDIEKALQLIPEDCETYKNLIDIESFAKWYVVAEVTGNWEPNLFYVLNNKGGKLKMQPIWDAEWSLGIACKGNELRPDGWYLYPHDSPSDIYIWKERKYFQYLFKDPAFVNEVYNVWQVFKRSVEGVKDKIRLKQREIQIAQETNFAKWTILGKYINAVMLVALPTWEEEVEYAASFFNNLKSASNLNGNLNCSKELEHYAS